MRPRRLRDHAAPDGSDVSDGDDTKEMDPKKRGGALLISATGRKGTEDQHHVAVHIKGEDDGVPMTECSRASSSSQENNIDLPENCMLHPIERGVNQNYLAVEPGGIFSVVWHRTTVLVSLLLLQSLSQFILEMYESLISKHVIIPLFLTMLVGAGGNAGNQAAVRAITGLVTKEFGPQDYLRLLRKELIVGLINGAILAGIGFGRVYYFYGNHDLFYSTIAITLSLFFIVVSSVVLGATLPFMIGALGYDREHAAPTIQVLMDITGVFITCALCSLIIPTSEHRSSTGPSPR